MSIRPFTSESYARDERPDAWHEVLGHVGLQPASRAALDDGHATALHRHSPGVALGRLAAGPQAVMARTLPQEDLPLALVPLDDGAVLRCGGSDRIVPSGHLVLLPRSADWRVAFQRDLRAIVLSVTSPALHGRISGRLKLDRPDVIAPAGLAEVVCRTLEATARTLDTLTEAEWTTVAQSLVDLLLTLAHGRSAQAADNGGSATQAATLHRICQTIERRLDDADLSPARVAQAEGISERYLQKLFEGIGDNFSHYVRERRLQRAFADLANPTEAHHSISEIAYRTGFVDSAHFSRSFRQRFGLSPRAYRQQKAEQTGPATSSRGQRGWPQAALLRAPQAASDKTEPCLPAPANDHDGRAHTRHYHLAADASRVHWGYFSRSLPPQLEIASGDTITVETLTQHASDDPERMIAGDDGALSVFAWTAEHKNVDRRGAGPMDASVFGRGAGEGFGVHICTGPVAITDAQPGDVIEVRILDIVPRRSRAPDHQGRVFGSSVAAWWGYHYGELLSGAGPREAVTIYEIFPDDPEPHARALYSYRWEPQTDPFGVVHATYDYPGVPVAPGSVKRRHGVLDNIRIPLRPHFGVIAVAPREVDFVDSIPPSYFGGNLDNWRLGKGSTVYLPVAVPGALLSVGDPHATQGDGELSGTAIECSMTGTFQVILHKKAELAGKPFADLSYPLIETATDWVLTGFSHPNYLAEFGAQGQSEVYATSSLDLAMKDAFRKMRRFLMHVKGLSEDEAVALMSAAVDFGVTQVVDGNWGVHAILSKRLFQDADRA